MYSLGGLNLLNQSSNCRVDSAKILFRQMTIESSCCQSDTLLDVTRASTAITGYLTLLCVSARYGPALSHRPTQLNLTQLLCQWLSTVQSLPCKRASTSVTAPGGRCDEIPPGAYPWFRKWGTNHGEREERGAEG